MVGPPPSRLRSEGTALASSALGEDGASALWPFSIPAPGGETVSLPQLGIGPEPATSPPPCPPRSSVLGLFVDRSEAPSTGAGPDPVVAALVTFVDDPGADAGMSDVVGEERECLFLKCGGAWRSRCRSARGPLGAPELDDTVAAEGRGGSDAGRPDDPSLSESTGCREPLEPPECVALPFESSCLRLLTFMTLRCSPLLGARSPTIPLITWASPFPGLRAG